jgi:peptidoglycan-N-acetylglucosamine deacetylase
VGFLKKVVWYFLCLVFILMVVGFGLWLLSRSTSFQLFGDLIDRVETQEKVVALTFDDGPSPQNTPEILDILKEYSVPATFFMIGQNIEQYLELAERVLKEGHQIANHSYSHKRMVFTSLESCIDEISKTHALIRELGFQGEIVFRPPFGKKLFTLPLALQRLKVLSVTWDAESKDTEYQDSQTLESNVLSHVKPGSIILFHDGFGKKEGTIAAIKILISKLKLDGYTFLTVNELRKKSSPKTSN